MGSGLACIATPTGATAEFVEQGRTGELVPVGDAGALASAVAGLLADPERAERLGRAGHEAVLARHTWSAVAARVASALARS
jgi:glycosyltransferase involved in cell wall biosynthesis